MLESASRARIAIVDGTPVVITPHALERFAQRVLFEESWCERAETLVEQMVPRGTIATECPEWAFRDDADAWILIGPDCAMPCMANKQGPSIALVAKTVLTRGGFSISAQKTSSGRRGRRRGRSGRRRREPAVRQTKYELLLSVDDGLLH